MKERYSLTATAETAALLVKLHTPFVCTYGVQSGKLRLFFLADEDEYNTIEASTRFSIYVEDEDLSWDFNDWNILL